MKRITALITVLLLIILTSCQTVASAHPSVEFINSYQNIPGVTEEEIAAIEKLKAERDSFSYGNLPKTEAFSKQNSRSGLTLEYCEIFSELFGIEFVQAPYDEWHDLKRDVDARVIDFTGDLTPNAERMRGYYVTKPVANRTQTLYTLADSGIKKATDVNGLKLGFIKDSVNFEFILNQYPELSFEVVAVDHISAVERMLVSGEIDGFVTERNFDAFFEGNELIKSSDLFPLAATPLCLVTANPELAPVISVLNKYLVAGGNDKLYESFKEEMYAYTKYKLFKTFTAEETAYLENLTAQNARVSIGLPHDSYPVSFYNETDKETQGIALDILAEISRLTGLEFEALTEQANASLSEILSKLKSGEISMVTQIAYTESRQDDYLWNKIPYFSTKYALLSRTDTPYFEIYQVFYKTVGTVYESAYEEMFNKWFPGHEYTIAYKTSDEAFDALEKGKADLLMLSERMLLTQTNYREKPGFKINIGFNTTLDFHFGFNKNEEILCSVVDKALEFVDTDRITSTWLNRRFDYAKQISQIRTAYLLAFAVAAIVVILVMASLLLTNKSLSKNLIARTTVLSTIFSSIPDTIFSKDTNGVYTSCNPSFEKQAGMPEAEIVGKTYPEVFKDRVSETVESYRDIDKKVINERTTEIVEETVIYPDGSYRILETLKAPLLENGKTVGILGIGRDVTERMEIKGRLDRIINTAQIVFMMSVDGIVVEANKYSRKHIGVKAGDEIRGYYSDPGQRDAIVEMAERQGKASNVVIRLNMANGESHRFLSNFTAVKYDQRKAYIMWALDIEQDELKKDQLRITQQSLQTVLDALPMPIRIVALDNSEIVYVNNSFLKWLEYESPGEVCGLNIMDILPEVVTDGTPTAERVDLLLEAEDSVSIEIDYRTKTGKIIESLVVARQIDYRGRRCSIGIIKDLTAEKEHARILLEAVEREKEANQTKSLFLANMSHEIRTPMNGIIGMTDLLMGERLIGRQLQYVKDIKTSVESLLGIINDILDLSKIGEGKLQIVPVDIDLNAMLKNTVSMMRFSAGSKGLDFIDDIRINSPEFVRVDDVRLKQILVNILSNAIKFTKTGHVRFMAKIENGNIMFEVGDTGVGIRQEDIPLIFKAFEQADKSKNRAIKGTGLGLSITKNLVELMNGRIWLESEYGTGTTFYVTIPYVVGDESAVEIKDTEFEYISAPTAQALLVDDIQTNLTVGAGLLRLCGITADVAMSGFEAIELVKSKDYDIVFMDHMMPEMDGIEAMELIKGMGGKYLDLPIIALTANAMNESRDLLLNAGMNGFLSKPIDKSALMGILKKWLPADKIEASVKTSGNKRSEPYSEVLEAASKIEGFNIELALSRISGMQDVLEASLRQSSQSIDGQIKKMDAYLSGGDLRGFTIEAHGLKGALANIGATHHSELAAELEIASKAENIPLCEKKFTVFASQMKGLATELKSIFEKTEHDAKPQGDKGLLESKVGEAIGFLDNFEAADALVRLNELVAFAFGEETDSILADVKIAVEAFNYEKAIAMLQNVINTLQSNRR